MYAARSVPWLVLTLAVAANARGDDPAKAPAEMLDLTDAIVVTPAGRSGPEAKAITVLTEELQKRTQLRWPVVHSRPEGASKPVIYVTGKDEAEKIGFEGDVEVDEGKVI